MASWYVDSNAVGLNNGTSVVNAWTSLNSATAGNSVAAGDTIYVSSAHSESAFTAYTNPGTIASRCRILSVDSTTWAITPSLKAGATIASATTVAIALTGFFYCYGIVFKAGGNTSSAANMTLANTALNYQRFEACEFWLFNTASGSVLTLNGAKSFVDLFNCTARFGAIGQSISSQGFWRWKNTVSAIDSGGSAPTNLFTQAATSLIFCEGVDFSFLSAKTLTANATGGPLQSFFKDCRFP